MQNDNKKTYICRSRSGVESGCWEVVGTPERSLFWTVEEDLDHRAYLMQMPMKSRMYGDEKVDVRMRGRRMHRDVGR